MDRQRKRKCGLADKFVLGEDHLLALQDIESSVGRCDLC